MTAKEIQKRSEKAQYLKVVQVRDDTYYVESAEGKICYRVIFGGDQMACTCGDYTRNIKNDQEFKCKHILSVMNCIPTGQVENGKFLEKARPKLDERFLMNIKGKDFVLYAGLLDMAHQKGLRKILIDAVQFPTKENGMEAICKATVESKIGEEFVEWGDANPKNVNKMIASHILRMAATRSKARALRDLTNIGMTCLEELGDLNDVIGGNTGKPTPVKKKPAQKTKPAEKSQPAAKKASAPVKQKAPVESKPKKKTTKAASKKEKPVKAQSAKSKSEDQSTQPVMSSAQKRAIYNLSRRRGVSVEELESMSVETYGYELENLSSKDASQFIRQLQQAA